VGYKVLFFRRFGELSRCWNWWRNVDRERESREGRKEKRKEEVKEKK
jgi:hypothetical protein